MRAILNSNLSEILRNRVSLSREIKMFTIEMIAEEWKITLSTLYRYNSTDLREKTRILAKKSNKKVIKADRSVCQICFKPIKGHERCKICTQLIHDYSRNHLH